MPNNDPKLPPKLPPGLGPHDEAKFLPPPETEAYSSSTTRGSKPELEAKQDIAPEPPSDEAAKPKKGTRGAKVKPEPTKEEKWARLVEAFHVYRRRLLRIPGATAVDIGYKIVGGVFTDELAVRLHIERKLPDDPTLVAAYKLRGCDFIPKQGLPTDEKKSYFKLKGYEDVSTDVIEADYKPMQGVERPRRMVLQEPKSSDEINQRRRIEPLVGGVSISGSRTPVGTLGALVWDNTDGSICILSNWHVLSGDLGTEAGAPCFQPGRFDHGRSSDIVARLKRWSFDRFTDAALAGLTGSRPYCAGEILSMDRPISGVADPYLGMLVRKSGRSTGPTWGFVDGLYFSSAIEYSGGVVQAFENQIHIAPLTPADPISDPGDSGSVWVSEQYEAVGLHFAGDLPNSAFGEYALANPMKLVMKALNFSFRPRFLEIRDEDVLPPPPLPIQTGEDRAGARPIGTISGDRLRGPGDHGDPIVVEPTGRPRTS